MQVLAQALRRTVVVRTTATKVTNAISVFQQRTAVASVGAPRPRAHRKVEKQKEKAKARRAEKAGEKEKDGGAILTERFRKSWAHQRMRRRQRR